MTAWLSQEKQLNQETVRLIQDTIQEKDNSSVKSGDNSGEDNSSVKSTIQEKITVQLSQETIQEKITVQFNKEKKLLFN